LVDRKINIIPFSHFLIITALFVVVNGAWYFNMGVMTDADTNHYLQYSQEIEQDGLFFKPHYFWYIGYVIFIWFIGKFSTGLGAIVFVQYVLSYLATLAIYKSSLYLFNSQNTALISVLMILGFVFIPFWNLFIYAESLFISLTCISFYFLIRWEHQELRFPHKVFVIGVWFWAFLTKPTGLSVATAVLVYFGVKFWQKKPSGYIKYLVFGILPFIFLVVASKMLNTFGFEEAYTKGDSLQR
jgi:hypothetical protein